MSYQYEFTYVNGQNTTSAFHKVVYSNSVKVRWAKLQSFTSSFYDVTCQTLLKSENVLRSYSINNTGTLF